MEAVDQMLSDAVARAGRQVGQGIHGKQRWDHGQEGAEDQGRSRVLARLRVPSQPAEDEATEPPARVVLDPPLAPPYEPIAPHARDIKPAAWHRKPPVRANAASLPP